MKVKNFFGDNMPILPWMINFDCPKRQCVKQEHATNASNQLEYQANLSMKARCAKYMLTTLMCALGVKNTDEQFITKLLNENIRSVCVDMSRGTEMEQLELIERIRSCVDAYSKQCGRVFPFCLTLEITGLRIRTGYLDSTQLVDTILEENNFVYLTTDDNYGCHCNKSMIYVNYKDILKILHPGNYIYIDFGAIILQVVEIGRTRMYYNQVKCKVINGGRLRDNALVHLPNVPYNYDQDLKTELISFAIKNKVDALVIARVRDAHIMDSIRQQLDLHEDGKAIMLIAKIEDSTALENIDEIIASSDVILIARGVLGLYLPPEKLFIAQKSIIAKCNKIGKPVLCGGHFLKSMYKNHLPTRAEMLDAANSVLDGTDGLFFSEELTTSPNLFEAIHNLQNICLEAEAAVFQKQTVANLFATLPDINEPPYSIAVSTVDTSMKINAACIIVLSVSGRSAKLIAQFRPQCPIIVVTRYGHVARKLNMWRGVIPLLYISKQRSEYLKEVDSRFNFAITFGKYCGLIRGGDKLILVSGWKECSGFTNTIRIVYASQNNSLYAKFVPCKKVKK